MLTLTDIANEKLRARKNILEGNFKIELYNKMLEFTIDNKNQGSAYFDDFETKKEFFDFVQMIRDTKENDFLLQRYIDDIEVEEEDLIVEVYFNITRKIDLTEEQR